MPRSIQSTEGGLESLVSTIDALPYRTLRKFSELVAMQAEGRDCTDVREVTDLFADVCDSFLEDEA